MAGTGGVWGRREASMGLLCGWGQSIRHRHICPSPSWSCCWSVAPTLPPSEGSLPQSVSPRPALPFTPFQMNQPQELGEFCRALGPPLCLPSCRQASSIFSLAQLSSVLHRQSLTRD